MAGQFLVRMYDVGLGDCIYCRIPEGHASGRDFHLLIDCGSLSGVDGIEAAIAHLERDLPSVGGKAHIDLLVVTHEHKDHIHGFGLEAWSGFTFGAIWMSAAMDPHHPQAAASLDLHRFAIGALSTALRQGLAMSPELQSLAAAAADNEASMTALRTTLPNANGIAPAYVHADSSKAALKLPLAKGIRFDVLGPENDIDQTYLGLEAEEVRRVVGLVDGDPGRLFHRDGAPRPEPINLAPADFRKLQSRMLSNALAFADLDGKVCNNTSVVLLVEWRGNRLLFVGDAEWDSAYKDGKANSSWNTMWKKRKKKLGAPVSFLKVGHHGSVNATPWAQPGMKSGEPPAILDAILPKSSKDKAVAIVSTRRSNYKTIPRSDLLVELGRRTSNARKYAGLFRDADLGTAGVPKFGEFEEASFASAQPPRTDLESMLEDKGFVEVLLPARG